MSRTVTISPGPTVTSGTYRIGSNTLVIGLELGTGGTVLNYGTLTDSGDISGQMYDEPGSKEIDTTILFFGDDYIGTGATSEYSIIGGGGNVFVSGLDEDPTLKNGNITVTGGTLIGAHEGAGFGGFVVLNSGSISGTTITYSGDSQSEYGGIASNDFFSNQSADIVYAGGTDLYTTFTLNGLGYIEGGSSSFATAIDADIDLLSGTQYDANIGTLASDAIVGGMASGTTIDARGNQFIGGGTVTGDVIETGGTVTQLTGTLLGITGNGGTLGATTLDGGMLIIKSGIQTGTVDFTSNGGTVIDATSNHLKISGFTFAAPGADIIDLSGTSIPKSRQVTLDSKGVLTIGSIKETFVHGAGMILNLTSTSSGVQITEKKAPAETSAASSSSAALSAKASSAFAANMWNDPKMDFLGTSMSDEPLGETHLANTSTAPLLPEAFVATDIIGLKGAASSALKVEAPSTSVEAAVATILFQNSSLAAAIFNAGKGEV